MEIMKSLSTLSQIENDFFDMEGYVYEKKKMFEMIKNRNRSKLNLENPDTEVTLPLPLQYRQCEKNILRNYVFKTKNNEIFELAPIKQKVMLKKRQSTEKNLLLHNDVTNENYCTNTICLQEDEFNIDEMDNYSQNREEEEEKEKEKEKEEREAEREGEEESNEKHIQNREESNLTAVNNYLGEYLGDFDDITFTKRGSSLNFQNLQSYDSSLLDVVPVTQGTSLHRRIHSNPTMNRSDQHQNKHIKKNSISSFIQKPTSNLIKRVRSFIHNSDEDVSGSNATMVYNHSPSLYTTTSTINVTNMESKNKGSMKKLFKSLSKVSKNTSKEKSHHKSKSDEILTNRNSTKNSNSTFFINRNFSLSSLRLKGSKSNISLQNNNEPQPPQNNDNNVKSVNVNATTINTPNNTINESRPLNRRGSLTQTVMRKIINLPKLSKLGSIKAIEDGKLSARSEMNLSYEKNSHSIGKVFTFHKNK
jgi:hypothetical protein